MTDDEKKKRDDEYIALLRSLSKGIVDDAKKMNDILEGIAVGSRAALSVAKYIQKKGVSNEAN